MACRDGDVGDLFEGVAPGLARLELDEVQDLGLVVQDGVMEALHDPLPILERRARPFDLGIPRLSVGFRDVRLSGQRQGSERAAGEGRVNQFKLGVRGMPSMGDEDPHTGRINGESLGGGSDVAGQRL
ncbi:UNVERIFIED_ORG: hypothetical protein ABIB19_003163 [Arthrobacter sp. UYEF10]